MKLTVLDVALGITMIASLGVLYVLAPLSGFSYGLLPLPPALFFSIPLSQAYLDGIRSARCAIGTGSGKPPRLCFRAVLAPRRLTWLVLWIAYFSVWEFISSSASRVGFDFPGSFMGSLTCLLFISTMWTSCLVWAPKCTRIWTLAPLVLLTAPVGITALWFVMRTAMSMLAAAGLYDPGYMSMGLVFGPPLLAALAAFAAAPAAWAWARWKGDAWFGNPESDSAVIVDRKAREMNLPLALFMLIAMAACSTIAAYTLRFRPGQAEAFLAMVDTIGTGFDRVVDVVTDRDHAYLCTGNGSQLAIRDISRANVKPTQLSSVYLPEFAAALAVADKRVYVADRAGLTIMDVSNPSSPRVVGRLRLPGRAPCTVAGAGILAFTANWEIKYGSDVMPRVEGRPDILEVHINIVDVSDPARPRLAGSLMHTDTWPLPAGTPSLDLVLAGRWVFCACGPAGLLVLDVSNPVAPTVVGTYKDGGNHLRAVDTHGSTAFIASSFQEGNSRLQIVNLDNPAKPVVLASLDTPGIAQDISIAGSLAFVTLGDAGLLIVDVSRPELPSVLDHYRPYASGQLTIRFTKVAASTSFAFVMNDAGAKPGLHILRRNSSP